MNKQKQKYTEEIGNMWLIMINPQKPVIHLIKMFNHFTALVKILFREGKETQSEQVNNYTLLL